MEQIVGNELADGASNPISILAVLMAIFAINLVIKLQHYIAQFHWLLINGARDGTRGGNDEKLPKIERNLEKLMRREDRDDVDLSRSEVKMVMERLGIFGSAYGPEGDRMLKAGGSIGAGEIARLFEEEEVSLDEIKEAFYVFDENCDGLIDPKELSEVLGALGISNVGESDCRDLIRNFDENGDGFIDFREFTKLVEKSLR